MVFQTLVHRANSKCLFAGRRWETFHYPTILKVNALDDFLKIVTQKLMTSQLNLRFSHGFGQLRPLNDPRSLFPKLRQHSRTVRRPSCKQNPIASHRNFVHFNAPHTFQHFALHPPPKLYFASNVALFRFRCLLHLHWADSKFEE